MDQRLTLDRLEHRTIQTVLMEEDHSELQLVITQKLADIQLCHASILRGDPIALLIGEQQMVTRNQAGTLTHERWAESPLGFHYLCDLYTMTTFLPNNWLSADGVNGAISGLLVGRPPQSSSSSSSGGGGVVQYMSSDWVANIYSNVEVNVPIVVQEQQQQQQHPNNNRILSLKPETEMIVFPLNIDQAHWVAVLVTCLEGTLRISLYNSLSSLGNKSNIIRNLPRIINAIITANPSALPTRWTEARWGRVQVSGVRTVQQENSDDCGIFAIRNCLSLLQRQQAPSLTLSESESTTTLTLRERYLRAYIDGVNSAQEHIFVDVAVGQTSQTSQNETVGAT